MNGMTFEAIAARITQVCDEAMVVRSENGQPFVRVPAAALPRVAALLRRDPALLCDALMDLTGYDRLKYPGNEASPANDAIAVVYLLFSQQHHHRVMLEVQAPRALCSVPTVSGLWPAALYFEREVFDLLGVQFVGHPSLERILCPDDWVGHPLRKDYLYPAQYHGVPHLRDGQHFDGAPRRQGDPEPTPTPAPTKKGHP